LKVIELKLDKITDIWNNFILKEEFFQKKINFNDDVKTNYFGDILYYFYDSLLLVEENTPTDEKDNFSTAVFYSIGLLQIIFIQHDLMREFFYIFDTDEDTRHNFEKEIKRTRDLRNELIGHPINRNAKTGRLRSTVFWGNFMSKNQIHYLKYTRKDNFKVGIQKQFSILNIISNHENTFKKYLNLILLNLKEHFTEYLEVIENIESMIYRKEKFTELISEIENNCTLLLSKHIVFNKDILMECNEKYDTHPRYRNFIDIFREKLEHNIIKLKNSVYNYLDEKDNLIEEKKKKDSGFQYNEDLAYFLLRLFEKRQIDQRTEILKETFSAYPDIVFELENMKNNVENDTEYYSSYFYLAKILLREAVSIENHAI
jgi:hypothetical protein